MSEPRERVISKSEASRFLVSHVGLATLSPTEKARARDARVRRLLPSLRCIQLDPLDAIGQNADLVVMARVRSAQRGTAFDALFPGHAFEHFAKERCLLPASAFAQYRDRAVETPWWRHSERMKKLDAKVVSDVLAEVRDKGPLRARDLEHRGSVAPMDWAGWKGTSSAAKLALEVLWTRCEVVVSGRVGRDKVYDLPARALPEHAHEKPKRDFESWALVERAHAAGLLPRAAGPWWSMISHVRTAPVVDDLIEAGEVEVVRVDGFPRTYLAPRGLLDMPIASADDELRILGPLDPLLWSRNLVRDVFDFDYVWEVYKPAAERRFGWYVCPLLHRGLLVGRIEATVEGTTLRVDKLWREEKGSVDEAALDAALERHAAGCGCDRVKRMPGARRSRA
ncbi:MAG: crosslink repair DNA glycosylase YcaQ family protein [Polyangiaceae bacterium]